MKALAIILLSGLSCITPRMTPALREVFPKMVMEHNDTVCLTDEYGYTANDSAIHINCKHKPKP